MNRSFDSATIAERFRLRDSPTLLARRDTATPMAFSRVRSDLQTHPRSLDVTPEAAYSFQILLQPLASDVWLGRRHIWGGNAAAGEVYMFDLTSHPTTAIRTSFDFIRFYLPQTTLDELAVEHGIPAIGPLSTRMFGRHDAVLHGLAQAVAAAIEQPGDATALFIDHVGLAFHAHVMRVYGDPRGRGAPSPGTLAPWQFRRVRDFMMSTLDGNPTVAELAKQCALSPSHFARAFRQTTGLPPHAWVMARRVEKAKAMLTDTKADLADIALSCGFTDQSHFTRIFTRHEGSSPGRWRKLAVN